MIILLIRKDFLRSIIRKKDYNKNDTIFIFLIHINMLRIIITIRIMYFVFWNKSWNFSFRSLENKWIVFLISIHFSVWVSPTGTVYSVSPMVSDCFYATRWVFKDSLSNYLLIMHLVAVGKTNQRHLVTDQRQNGFEAVENNRMEH